jgi:tetratricopeptide (TPR) repeat protein
MNDKPYDHKPAPDSRDVEVLSHPGPAEERRSVGQAEMSQATTALVMEALERLAAATDRVAQQVRDHLGDMRHDITEDLARTRGTLQQLQNESVGQMRDAASAAQQLVQRVSGEWDEDGKGRDQALRTALAEGLDGVVAQIERTMQSHNTRLQEHVDQRLDEQAEQAQGELGELRRALDGSQGRDDEQWQALQAAVAEVQSSWASRCDELETKLESLRDRSSQDFEGVRRELDELRERVTTGQDQLRQQVDQAGRGSQQLQEALTQQIDRLRGEASEKRQQMRERLDDLQKTLDDVVQTSGQHMEQLDSRLTEQHENLQRWRTEHESRLDAVEVTTREVQSLTHRLEKNHADMLEFFEQERELAQQQRSANEKEEARRLNNAGVSRYHAGDYEQARELFEQAVDRDKSFAEAFNNLGLCLTELNEHEDATVAFETAIELNPDLGPGYNNLGYVLFKQQNYEAAIEMYKEAIGRSHDTSAAYTNLGNAYQKTGRSEEAVSAWQKALQIDPANARAARYLERHTAGVTEDAATVKDDAID